MFYLRPEEAKEFLDRIENKRDRLMYELFLTSGMRCFELQKQNREDILGKRSFKIIGKGQVEREIFLPEDLVKKIQDFCGRKKTGPLFLSNRGKRISLQTIKYLSKKYLRQIGIDKKGFGTHSLRHSALTEIYRQTKDLRLTQEIAGHSSPDITQIYTHIFPEQKMIAVESMWK
jgi:site-specific recombinase XerD